MNFACNDKFNKFKQYCNDNFTVNSTHKTRITGIVFSIVLVLFTVVFHTAFTKQTFAAKWFLLGFALLLPLAVGLVIAYPIHSKNAKTSKLMHRFVFFAMPLLFTTAIECLNMNFIFQLHILGILGNYFLVLLLYAFFYAITGSFRVSFFVVNTPIFVLAVVHNYVLTFRGDPFLPFDIFAAKTAQNVAAAYDFSPTFSVIIALMLMVIITTFSIRINMPSHTKRYRIITRVVSAIAFVVFMATYFGTSLLVNIGMKPDFWKQDRGYKNYGFTLMFFLNTRYVRDPDPPKDYDPGHVSQTAQKYSGIYDSESTDNSTTTVKPNIICIMNESLSDLSVLGDFETNEDYMPFIRSLTKNTVRGNLYVPVVGAGTSNTELEFLSGHTTAFLPSGSNAYMLYIRNPLGTMVTTLKRQGYSTLAFHPYYASGWNRTSVYNFMEFDRFVSMEDLFTPEYMKAYEKCSLDPAEISAYDREVHPDEQVLLRQYVSDSYDFKYIIKDFENRQKGVPYYIFNVTMQNHGGYMMQYPNFDETIKVTSGSKDYPKANQYLSLVKQSDDAFKELISYFEKVDEPTIICMFGDHQPTIENDFIEEVMGVSSLSFLSPEQEQLRHVTPFIIWSNYDIKEQKIERLSVNYLSSLLLEIAGVKLTPYNKAMLAFKDRLPVINSVGYIDNDGNHYSWGQTTEYSGLLQDYEILQYNNIFDVANRDDSVFYLTDGKQGQK